MEFTRRKFLRLAPASVGAIALGVAAVSTKPRMPALTMASLPDANTLEAMGETMLSASQKAADPPLAIRVGDLVMFDDKTHVVKWTYPR